MCTPDKAQALIDSALDRRPSRHRAFPRRNLRKTASQRGAGGRARFTRREPARRQSSMVQRGGMEPPGKPAGFFPINK